MTDEQPKALYDRSADRWKRKAPSSLSDFTGRPAVFKLCAPVEGQAVLDLGCGEGYCSRQLASMGAKSVLGIDISEQMIELAKAQETENPAGIEYRVGDIRNLDLQEDGYDLVTAVFVFNYITIAEMTEALTEMRRVVRPGGRVVFSVPHPSFPWMRDNTPPFYFDFGDKGYFSGRDTRNHGEIFRIDGTGLTVQMMHKTFEDYFSALSAAGFERLPIVKELRVLDEHVEQHPEFMGPIVDTPLHVAFSITK